MGRLADRSFHGGDFAWVVSIMMSQSQHNHDTPNRGPGRVSKAASVVWPCVIA